MNKLTGDNITWIVGLLIVGATIVGGIGLYNYFSYDEYKHRAFELDAEVRNLESSNHTLSEQNRELQIRLGSCR